MTIPKATRLSPPRKATVHKAGKKEPIDTPYGFIDQDKLREMIAEAEQAIEKHYVSDDDDSDDDIPVFDSRGRRCDQFSAGLMEEIFEEVEQEEHERQVNGDDDNIVDWEKEIQEAQEIQVMEHDRQVYGDDEDSDDEDDDDDDDDDDSDDEIPVNVLIHPDDEGFEDDDFLDE